jgi:hypothetical protein
MQKWKIATMMLAITVSSGESRIIQTSAAGKIPKYCSTTWLKALRLFAAGPNSFQRLITRSRTS